MAWAGGAAATLGVMKPAPGRDLCPRFHFAVELIGRRWTGAIVSLLLQGPARFAELRDGIPAITDAMLTERLRELEAEGVAAREVLPGAPVRVRYALTKKGRALGRVMTAIGDWSHAWLPAPKARAARKAPRR